MLRIVYEDDDLVVIDKPAGLLTHPTPHARDGTALDLVRAHTGTDTAQPAHRLDRPTSGLLAFAKHARAQARLMAAFAERRVQKAYVAVVIGTFDAGAVEIDAPIGTVDRRWAVTPEGRPARTTLTPGASDGARTRVDLTPHTGRTRQLRLHCAHVGRPIVGDDLHGGPPAARLHLHAARLVFPHPRDGRPIALERSAPDGLDWRG